MNGRWRWLDKKISHLALCKYEIRDFVGSPEGIRTLVADLRSQSPRPLDDGAIDLHMYGDYILRNNFLERYVVVLRFRWGTRTRT